MYPVSAPLSRARIADVAALEASDGRHFQIVSPVIHCGIGSCLGSVMTATVSALPPFCWFTTLPPPVPSIWENNLVASPHFFNFVKIFPVKSGRMVNITHAVFRAVAPGDSIAFFMPFPSSFSSGRRN
jgi:hypothetical protein